MPRIVVTGASGFVGRQTLAPLVARGFEVHAVGRNAGLSVAGVTWHRLDLLEEPALPFLADLRATHLLHGAWTTQHGVYWSSPDNARWVEASQALFTAFADCGGTDIVGVGSCAEYDWVRSDDRPWRESDPCRPATIYGRAKLDLSVWLEAFARERGLRQAWARLFFLFGEGEDPARLVPYLLRCAVSGEVARCTSGYQVRDFIDTQACGERLAVLAASGLSGAVNIGSGQGISVRDVAAMIEVATGKTLVCDFGAVPDRAGDPPSIVADMSRVATVGVTPYEGLLAGLAGAVRS